MVIIEFGSQELHYHHLAPFFIRLILFLLLLDLLADRLDRIDRREGTLSELFSQFDLMVGEHRNFDLSCRVVVGVN